MMKAIKFTKMVASGNDFVVIQGQCEAKRSLPEGDKATSHKLLARKICDRKYGVGADGLLLLEKSKVADVRMRIFNADGSEAEMCGNGARCVALYVSHKVTRSQGHKLRIETRAGVIAAEVKKEQVKIKLTDPRNIKLDIPIKVGNRNIKVNFINTGVPHTVVFVEGLEKISVPALGRQIRFHRCFASAGTNVDFVEAISNDSIQVRTYERGVEDETLACGTGSVASALVFALTMDYGLRTTDHGLIKVHTQGGETLKVFFQRRGNNFTDVWLEGKARKVYAGVWNV